MKIIPPRFNLTGGSPRFNLTSCKGLAFTGPMVLFKGSFSRSAKFNAVVELKLIPAAVNQSTPTIDYNPFTESFCPIQHPHCIGCKFHCVKVQFHQVLFIARDKVWVSTTSKNFCTDVVPPCSYSSFPISRCLRSCPLSD